MKESTRVIELDVVKGLAIIFMVIGHCNHFLEYESLPIVLIYGFHMPLFLLVSGIAMRISIDRNNERGLTGFVRNKIDSLLRPYFIVSFVSVFISFMQNGNVGSTPLRTILMGQAATNDFSFNLPLWFLPLSFCAQVIFFVVTKLGKNKVVGLWLTLCLGVLGYYCMSQNIAMAWNLDLALLVQPFLGLGYWGYHAVEPFYKKYNIRQIVFFSTICLPLYIWLTKLNTRVDLNARRINSPILFFLGSSLGIICVFMIAKLICLCGHKFVSCWTYLGRNTLAILCWHIPVSGCFYTYIVPLLPETVGQVVWAQHGLLPAILILLVVDVFGSVLLHRAFLPQKL